MSKNIQSPVISPPATLSFNQEIILIAIKGSKLYPKEIGEKIKKTNLYTVKVATLYPILRRLEDYGLIKSTIIEERKKYSLSVQGENLINTTEKIRKTIQDDHKNSNN